MSRKILAQYRPEIEECARRYNGLLYRFLFRFTRGDHALAEDLVQQVLMEVAETWTQFRELTDRERVNRLYQMATRRAIDTFRKNRTARDNEPELLVYLRTSETDPHQHAVIAVVIDRFLMTLDTLPAQQFLAATLHWRCGWKNAEIADALDISPSAVTQLLAKARTVMRRELGPYLASGFNEPEGRLDHE